MRQDELIRLITEAFSRRARPVLVVPEDHPPTDIYEDALFFRSMTSGELTCKDIATHSAATSGFSPEAFCYFLPGILVATIREDRPDLIGADGIIYQLDRSNMTSSWDDFFSKRWPMLSREECRAVQHWVLWLTEFKPPVFEECAIACIRHA